MSGQEKVFKYKLDFYYQSALIYLVTLIVYGGIRGSFVEKRFLYVLDDPLMYIIIFFVAMSLIVLGLNYLRQRRLIITDQAVIFKHRWDEHRVNISDIEWIHIGREPRVRTSGRSQIVIFKLKGRRRFLRIRIGRYEHERELLNELTRIGSTVPKRRHGRWRRPKFTDT